MVLAGGLAAAFSILPGFEILTPIAATFEVGAYNLPSFCAAEPPTFPTFTTPEIEAYGQGLIDQDYYSFLTKAKDFVGALFWYQQCQCVTGPQPTMPTPPALPSDAPVFIGPSAVPVSAACASIPATGPQSITSFGPPPILAPYAGPYFGGNSYSAIGARFITGGVGSFDYGYHFPTGTTQYTLTFHRQTTGGTPGGSWEFGVYYTGYQNGVEFDLGGDTATIAHGGADITRTYSVVAGQIGVTVLFALVGADSTDVPFVTAAFFCGTPGAAQTPCCPPDQSMLLLLQQIRSLVTLTQRQLAPFSYVTKSVTLGLSGTGEISVQGLLGLRIDLTTVPARLGQVLGHPIDLWDAGWINLGTADGFGPRQFISSNPFLLRPVAPDVTRVGYSIPADVVISITELVREP
jgi:hypothetical protein